MPEPLTAADLRVGFLASMPASALQELAKAASSRVYSAGAKIFSEGDPGGSLHIVRSGRAKVVKFSATGAEQVLEQYGPGGVCGELTVFSTSDANRTATFVAVEDCETIEVSKADIDRCLVDGTVARTLLGSMATVLTAQKEQRTMELHQARFETILLLARAAEFFDEATGRHILRMAAYSARLGQAAGLSQGDWELLLNASMLHDVGKFTIPEYILKKPGPFEPDERERMKTHTTMGYELLEGVQSDTVRLGREIALQHHERWDGQGYPRGIRRDAIDLHARICAVADVFDALTSRRPYKDPMPVDRALQILKDDAGTHFDPDLVALFIDHLEDIIKLGFLIDAAPTLFFLAVASTGDANVRRP